ncbi:hypothetical protein FQN54_009122 [Arachnomyces sp. PD_36]|nr:hypothetical protein FQN54_009122 [Arachnomyces sp. PD_36]
MPQPQPYSHPPLPSSRSIRLLTLSPSLSKSSPIHCHLRPIAFDDSTTDLIKYEALSYVWGSSANRRGITCSDDDDGEGGSKGELLVTNNCYEALLHLRSRYKPRTLWIDSICIDQTESKAGVSERNAQIKLMGEVYNRAERVVVWLGVGGGWTRGFIGRSWVLGNLALCTLYYKYTRRVVGPVVRWGFGRLKVDANTERAAQFNKLLEEFVEHPWFTRVWTFQELVFARRCVVCCARSSISWPAFMQIIVEMNGAFKGFHQTYERILFRDDIRDLISDDDEKVEFHPPPQKLEWGELSEYRRRAELTLITTLGYLRATLPHDRLYAFHAVFRSIGIWLPDPDYRKPVPEAFGEMVKGIIRSRKKLTIISLAGRGAESTDDGVPSWIPDFMNPVEPDILDDNTGFKFLVLNDWRGYRASGGSKAVVPDESGSLPGRKMDPRRLVVKGKCLGRITERRGSPPEPEEYDLWALMSSFREWCFLVATLTAYPTGITPLSAFCHTLLFHLKETDPRPESYFPEFSACFDLMITPDADLEEFASMDYDTEDEEIRQSNIRPQHPGKVIFEYLAYSTRDDEALAKKMRRVIHVLRRIKFFVLCLLDSGYFCLGFHSCTVGDEVWVLAGADCPVVLRRVGVGGDEYRVVANGYVYGVMGGEEWPDGAEGLREVVLV